MTRRQFRETCFRILFAVDFYPADEADEEITQYLEDQTSFEETECGEIRARVNAVIAKADEIDEKISSVTEGWKLQRIGKVELSILRQAVYEIFYDEDVPEKVAINEAIEIAKKYCGDEAPAFVNGILAKLVK